MKPIIASLLALSAVATISASADTSSIRHYSNSTLLKNYALSQCIARAYDASEMREDALVVADGYLQFGDVSNTEAYGKAVTLAEA